MYYQNIKILYQIFKETVLFDVLSCINQNFFLIENHALILDRDALKNE